MPGTLSLRRFTMTIELLQRPTLSQRLKHETNDQHERMYQLMERGNPTRMRALSPRNTCSSAMSSVCSMTRPCRPRSPTCMCADARKHRLPIWPISAWRCPEEPIASSAVKMPEALGWLYVSEGSTLGAAFLFKDAQTKLGLSDQFGARKLAAYPEGRAIVWRRFVASLDNEQIARAEHDAIIAGANAAYDRFGTLLKRFFQLA